MAQASIDEQGFKKSFVIPVLDRKREQSILIHQTRANAMVVAWFRHKEALQARHASPP